MANEREEAAPLQVKGYDFYILDFVNFIFKGVH